MPRLEVITKELRKNLGFKVEAVAKDLGISKTAYSQLENGHVEITLNKIEAIANIYKVTIAELVPSIGTNYYASNGSFSTNHGTNTIIIFQYARRKIARDSKQPQQNY